MSEPDETTLPTDLAQAVRHTRVITDYLLRLPPDAAVAEVVAERLAEVVRLLDPHVHAPQDMVPDGGKVPEHLVDRSPVTGVLNAIAPPVDFTVSTPGRASTKTRLGLPYQGPPGRVHGGWVATLLDHLMGCAAASAGPGYSFTRTLTVDYDAGVPLFEELTITGHVKGVEGRKIWMTGDITAGGSVLARARGLWLSVGAPPRSTDRPLGARQSPSPR